MEHWWILTFLNFLQSLEASYSLFLFSSCAQSPYFWGLFSPLYHGSNLFGGWGGNTLSRIQWEKNLYPFQLQIHSLSLSLFFFLSLPVSTKPLWNQHHHALWEKRKTFCSLSSAGSWRVLGPCVAVHRILDTFLLSLYIGVRDYTVSLCEYGQLALPTCICLFSLV